MRNNAIFSKNKWFILLISILLLAGCQFRYNESRKENYVYITYETYNNWQVWQIEIDGGENHLIYSLPKWIRMDDYYDPPLFSEEILGKLINKYTEEIKTKKFETGLSIKISPNKEMMAITENYRYCPGDWCDGQYSIKIIDIKSGNILIEYYSETPLSSPKWSRDENYILFEKSDDDTKAITYSLHIWNIIIGQEVLVVKGESPEFIGDTNKVLLKYYSENQIMDSKGLSCCKVIDPIMNEEKIVNINENINYNPYYVSSLSPDGKKMAFEIHDDSNLLEIKIIDFSTLEQLHSFFPENRKLYLWKMDWSMNGSYLAFDNGIGSEHLLEVVDVESGKTILREESVLNWIWSSIDQRMLLAINNNPNSCIQKNIDVFIIDLKDGEKTIVESPIEIKDFVDSINNDDVICIQYIKSITW